MGPAMKPQTGLLLRLIGPLIEVLCIIGFLSYRGRNVRLAGQPVELLFLIGFLGGMILVILGLTMVRRTKPSATRRSWLDEG